MAKRVRVSLADFIQLTPERVVRMENFLRQRGHHFVKRILSVVRHYPVDKPFEARLVFRVETVEGAIEGLAIFERTLIHDSIELSDRSDAVRHYDRYSLGESSVPALLCHDCQTTKMDVHFTSKALGYSLCEGCFKGREDQQRAKEVPA